MAAPIGHIYLALRLLAGPLHGIDEQAFLIGTSFPDIRYWIHAPREYTHIPVKELSDILKEPNAFRAGMLFHSFVDNKRYKFFEKHPLNKAISLANINGYLMKNTEDIVLFPLLTDKSFVKYFDKILPEETALVHDSSLVRRWHVQLQNYFLQGPTAPLVSTMLCPNGEKPNRFKQMAIAIFCATSKRLAALKTVRDNILAFYDNFDVIVHTAPAVHEKTLPNLAHAPA